MIQRYLNDTRIRTIAALGVTLMAVHLFTRLGLLVFNGDFSIVEPISLVKMFALGMLFDIAVVAWWLTPLALLYWIWPDAQRSQRVFKFLGWVIGFFAILIAIFVSLSEFVFWDEFSSRFNFIAVDYLIYSREVVGNIRESYNLPLLLGGVAVVAIAAFIPWNKRLALAHHTTLSFRSRSLALSVLIALATLLTYGLEASWKNTISQPQISQLSGNGPWEFFHAFRSNQINYANNYRVLPTNDAEALVRADWQNQPGYRLTGSKVMPIEREVIPNAPMKPLNVVMVSIESFGAEFIGSLGGSTGLTPNYEKLSQEGLYFKQLYATGTRTVRGLEALTLSVPPTPGHAIPMRLNNSGLFTIGGVFREKGYESIYVYGGYSQFDNMKSFFGGNGYTVIDRTALNKADIHHENIWGVCDEDLFTLALRELDQRIGAGKKVFAHVMTTSNHRPYTYPPNRIDIPSGTNRFGAVKYTDFAIGQFVEKAKKKPWFKDTVFVFVADHTAIARGYSDLPLERYHIPMVIYAPSHIAPQQITEPMSQIDVAPTILGLLNVPYISQFFGQDALKDKLGRRPLYLGNYQTVGMADRGMSVELKPKRSAKVFDLKTREVLINPAATQELDKAVAAYQVASKHFSTVPPK
jgi:phosphoglycerol transferase MdoB-like AlkP superfamily enzyme